MHPGHQQMLPLIPTGDAPEFLLVQHVVQEYLALHSEGVEALAACAHLEAYTDGSAPVVNPGGPAGFAAVVLGWHSSDAAEAIPPVRLELSGCIPARTDAPATSNNRAEVAGILVVLVLMCALPAVPLRVVIWSDSEYAVNCAAGRYARRKNLDLWEGYDRVSGQAFARIPDIRLEWLKGHAGTAWNEVADDLATRAALSFDDRAYRCCRTAQRATGREMPRTAVVAGENTTEQARSGASSPANPALWLRGAHYTLVLCSTIDGGGRANIGRGPATGHYQIWTRAGKGTQVHLKHSAERSADEAEYLTLIAALDDLLSRIEMRQRDPAAYSLTVYSRRELVVKQLDGTFRVRSATLQPLRQLARTHLDRFSRVDLLWKQGNTIAHLLRP